MAAHEEADLEPHPLPGHLPRQTWRQMDLTSPPVNPTPRAPPFLPSPPRVTGAPTDTLTPCGYTHVTSRSAKDKKKGVPKI